MRPRLLLLEDLREEAENLIAWLDASFEITHVTSVHALRHRLAEVSFHVALIDLCVDDSQGLDTFLAVHAAAPELPIVVQSGLDGDAVALEAVARGAQDYLVKRSFTAELVRRALRYAMERGRVERELRESRERYRLALAGANDGVWDWDLVAGTFRVSERWCEMLGLGQDEVGEDPEGWLALLHPSERDEVWDTLQAHLTGQTPHFEVEHRVSHGDGGWRWVRTRGLAVRDGAGRATRIAGSQGDITERRNFEARLLRDATTDTLTGLANRAAFVERLRGALARAAMEGARGCAVLFLDLDRFKLVNDSLGHQVGDRLLVAVAQRLRMSVRPQDLVARFGGDEFALLVEAVDSAERVAELAARIHRSLSLPFHVGSQQIHASGSIGIVHCAGEAEGVEEVLRNADIAMYRSKRAGRGCTEVFSEADHAAVAGRLDLETGLRRALAQGELVLHYQPIVRIPDASLVGFESLVRWRTPEGRLVQPSEFIPVAEECGLIHQLGAWALRAACQRMADLTRALPAAVDLSVSVNVSARQFADPGLVGLVERALVSTGLSPRRLGLEVTESALIDDPDAATVTLGRLRAMGVRIHLDDFGIGYSSLSYLRRFPIDCLKIDRSFTQSVPGRHQDEAIIRAIVALADALGLEVVAEGVEREEQWAHLVGLQCGYGQGFFFSHPLEGLDVESAAVASLGRGGRQPPRSGQHPPPAALRG